MGDPNASPPDARPASRRVPVALYRVEILREVHLLESGIRHRTASGEHLLRWDAVRFGVAAEVGEPEGVRAIVFDLVLGRDADGWSVARLDADPGTSAEEIARAIHAGLAPEQRGPSIKSLATDGVPSWWFADLEGFEEAVVAALEPAGA